MDEYKLCLFKVNHEKTDGNIGFLNYQYILIHLLINLEKEQCYLLY